MGGKRRLVNCIAFDDSPFSKEYHGPVQVVATVYAGLRLDGVLIGSVEKDGYDAATQLVEIVSKSRFHEHCNLIMLQGICLAGFNVVDAKKVHKGLSRPVLVVSRKKPDYQSMRKALFEKIPNGKEKWKIIEELGPMEPCESCFVQRVGLGREEAREVINFFCINGNIPEPLRTAHLIAGAIGTGHSKGRV